MVVCRIEYPHINNLVILKDIGCMFTKTHIVNLNGDLHTKDLMMGMLL